ncbi:MAG: T9SS type A sorting domain-containing protein [Candidatus Latescibacterota bacterium]|nr:MAG: T9SS type A sorting domain-containing protein [Candidatus Latescibacterota bacterium]
MFRREGLKKPAVSTLLIPIIVSSLLFAATSWSQTRTYTLDADFDEGFLVNVNHDPPNNDQLQLSYQTESFPYINVACSGRGTMVRINTETGEILGEYRTAPEGRSLNPSRTTVDAYGNVWIGNRNEAEGGSGSVVMIGLVVGGTRCDSVGTPNPAGEYLKPPFSYSTAVDRDNDGLIKTSKGLGHVLDWPDITDGAGGSPALVEDADDECILIYQRVNGDNIRHVSVDANNNVWVGGHFGGDNAFDLLDGDTGSILATFDVGEGGYGGVVDGNGILWSSDRMGQHTLLRYDTKGTIPTVDDTWDAYDVPNAYGIGVDSNGNIWQAQYTDDVIYKFASDGNFLGSFGTGGATGDRGVAVTPADDHVWVANSHGSDVSRLDNNGAVLKVISLGGDGLTPTGVAVDADGKVWATCYTSNTAKRIDPSAGADNLGAVDLSVDLGPNADPYNYSDMTGALLLQVIQSGTWTVVHDSGEPGIEWGNVRWNDEPEGAEPAGTNIKVEVRAADTIVGLPSQTWVEATNGMDFSGMYGRYVEIRATLSRDTDVTDTPVLSDLTIRPLVQEVYFDIKPTSCPNPLNINPFQKRQKNAKAKKGGVLPVAILGTEDFDVHDIDISTILLVGVAPIRHDYEDVTTPYDGMECGCATDGPDGFMDLTLKFEKMEIVAALGAIGPGDIVPLKITGELNSGIPIEGVDCVTVLGRIVIDGRVTDGGVVLGPPVPNPFNPVTRISYYLPREDFATVSVFDVTGRLVVVLKSGHQEAGVHSVEWDAKDVPSGVYFYRLRVGDFNESRKMLLVK